jgi:lipoprotein-releasing system permease protein
MSLSLINFLAWRYVSSRSSSTLRTMITVCFASIFIGTCSLALITAIMRGFEYETHKKLQSIYPCLLVKAPDGTTLDYERLIPFLKKKLSPTVSEISPYLLKHALIHPATTDEPTQVITLKGIDPATEPQVTALEKMISPANALSTLTKHSVIIGKDLAHTLEVAVGDQAVLMCNENEDESFKEASLRSIPVTIAGIITTGISDYDERLILATLTLCQTMWTHDCVTYLGLRLRSPNDEQKTLAFLQQLEGLESYSWKDFYPSLVSALKLEKYVMFALLLLITLVASMNIISLLFMYITYKRTDIALLKMLGMSFGNISLIFLLVSTILTAIATISGLLCAFIIGLILERYQFIRLPDAYYITHLPITLEAHLFLLVFLLALVLSILASCIPLRSIKQLNITHTLRNE